MFERLGILLIVFLPLKQVNDVFHERAERDAGRHAAWQVQSGSPRLEPLDSAVGSENRLLKYIHLCFHVRISDESHLAPYTEGKFHFKILID